MIDLSGRSIPADLPPVVLFCYSRPDLLAQVLDAIAAQSLRPDKVIAVIDYPADPENQNLVQNWRQCHSLLDQSPLPIRKIARIENYGLRRNIVFGLNEVLSEFPAAVYLEDDILPGHYCYETAVKVLDLYQEDKQIFCLNFRSPTTEETSALSAHSDFLLSRDFICQSGFAIWADRWRDVYPDIVPGQDRFAYWKVPTYPSFRYIPGHIALTEAGLSQYWSGYLKAAAGRRDYWHLIARDPLTTNIGKGHPASVNEADYEPSKEPFESDFRPYRAAEWNALDRAASDREPIYRFYTHNIKLLVFLILATALPTAIVQHVYRWHKAV